MSIHKDNDVKMINAKGQRTLKWTKKNEEKERKKKRNKKKLWNRNKRDRKNNNGFYVINSYIFTPLTDGTCVCRLFAVNGEIWPNDRFFALKDSYQLEISLIANENK